MKKNSVVSLSGSTRVLILTASDRVRLAAKIVADPMYGSATSVNCFVTIPKDEMWGMLDFGSLKSWASAYGTPNRNWVSRSLLLYQGSQ